MIFLPPGVAPERSGKPAVRGGQLMVCSRVAEGGSGLAWLDMDGRKLWGQHWLGGVWTAASHLAVDRGPNPVAGTYAYAGASWPGDKYNQFKNELRLHRLVSDAALRAKAPRDRRFGTGEDRPVLSPTYRIPEVADPAKLNRNDLENLKNAAGLTGMAVYNGIIGCSFEKLNHILFVDAHAGRVLGTSPAEAPRGLAFDRRGDLYVLSGKQVLRFPAQPQGPWPLPPSSTVVADGLEDPQYLTVADDGRILVSDWGGSHQVKIFSADGRRLGAIGDPGAPRMGAYNPRHMNHPSGMALDDRGRLWVAENTHIPKRVSIWDPASGELLEGLYGPMRYGGSGIVDPADKTRFFYDDDHGGTLEFKLDYATGKSEPTAILYLENCNRTGLVGRYVGAPPSYPLRHGGRLYLTDAYNLHTTGRRCAALWRRDRDGVLRIVAAAGTIIDAAGEVLPAFRDAEKMKMPAGFVPGRRKALCFIWSDLNGNQQLEPEEVQYIDPREYSGTADWNFPTGTVSVDRGLAFAFSNVGGAVLLLAPVRIDANGVPVYDAAERRVLAVGAQGPASSGGNQVLTARDGWVITSTPVKPLARQGLGGVRNGRPMWSYPSLWPGLHASHIAPLPENPGQVIGSTRVIGNVIDAPAGSDAGQLWAINGNKGNVYIFTTDGLFVSRLFRDSRTAGWHLPEAKAGMNIDEVSLQEECFGPTWIRTDGGEVLLQCGFTGNLAELKNLDRVRRLPSQTLEVSPADLDRARQWGVENELHRRREAAAAAGPLIVPILDRAPVVDGDASDWPDHYVEIDRCTHLIGNWGKAPIVSRAKMAVAGDTLYVAWQSHDRELLRNSGESLEKLFKCGGALDLMIGADPAADPKRRQAVSGDQRLLISRTGKELVAVLYEPVAPDTAAAEKVEFGSPLRTLLFDRVDVVSDRIRLASKSVPDLRADRNGSVKLTTYEAAIPLSLLKLNVKPDLKLRCDVGFLRGDGRQTLQRVYWRNKASGLVSDIPGEAELLPALWGELEFRK